MIGLRLPKPKPVPYDVHEWVQRPWPERMKLACQAWAQDGYGAPGFMYVLYALKVCLYVGAWAGFCLLSEGIDDLGRITQWASTEVAFKKAIVWSMAFESLGLGCGSGPLTGRYWPPVTAPLHFCRPGTLCAPLFPRLPILGSARRHPVDVLLYVGFQASLWRVLLGPQVTATDVLPCLVLLGLIAIRDKTIFIAARSEHYAATMVCFLFPDDWVAGAMAVNLALWVWAAVSKFNRHFPAVLGVMTSNSPSLNFQAVRRRMYRDFPNDLRPSRLARFAAHTGTLIELGFPVALVMGQGGPLTMAGLAAMLVFHVYITSHIPMAVPIEWNVMVVYSGFWLFGGHATTNPTDIQSPGLATFIIAVTLLVPLVGNLFPSRVSFLMAMRYYAGNWAYSVWLFRGQSSAKLDTCIAKAAERPEQQLRRFFDEETIVGLMGKVPAFRAMHLHGRALGILLPRAVKDIDDYEYFDGEIIGGLLLGYNFGDGHLHNEDLLHAVQQRCQFEPGELRHVFVESQPLFRPRLAWRITDACSGRVEEGTLSVDRLSQRDPWQWGA